MTQEPVYRCGSETAAVILHEIYGINRHIRAVCRKYAEKGFDVYCPHLIRRDPFPYSKQEEAYSYFQKNIGFSISSQIRRDLKELRPRYAKIFLIGYSIGATLAWISAQNGSCDGLIAYYGSRIRDYAEQIPSCPSLLLFAEREASFDVSGLVRRLQSENHCEVRIFRAEHGFCDPFGPSYNAEQAVLAEQAAENFLSNLTGSDSKH